MSENSQQQDSSGLDGFSPNRTPGQQPEFVSEAALLLQWIEQNPDYEELVKQAKGEKLSWKWPKPIQWLIQLVFNLLFANPEEFHGKAFVPKELKEHSQVTARVVSASSLLDFATNSPLLFFAFKDLGIILALIVSTATNIIVLKFTNDTATAVSGRNRGNRLWSRVGVLGLVSMNALQSLFSGIGVELLLNQSVLVEQKSAETIQEQIRKTEAIKDLQAPKYKDAIAQCDKGNQELNSLPRSHPRWDSLYVQLQGRWEERNQDWSKVPLEKLPTCRQVVRLRDETFRNYEAAKADLEIKLTRRVQIGNDVVFLQQEMPAVYAQHFTPNGEFKSGVEAVRLATQNFFGKMKAGDIEGSGFSLFFFSLSVITSGAACFMAIAHAHRDDTKMSRDPNVEEAIHDWLEDIRRDNLRGHLQGDE